MSSSSSTHPLPRANSPDPELAIEVTGLVKRFADVVAVAGLDLAVRRGECVGLLGPNGAGKTTTLEILEGLQEPTDGSVFVLGRSWKNEAHEIRRRIGLALQETRFYDKLTVSETVRLFRSFYGQGVNADEAIGYVQLQEKSRARVGELSGGQRQRLAVAVALVGKPELIFLDEPTTGLDPQSRRSLWGLIARLKSEGRTVLLTTHYMEEAEALCDRVVIVDHGKVVAAGTTHELILQVGAEHIVELATEPHLPSEAFFGLPSVVDAKDRDASIALTARELHVAVPALLGRVVERQARLVRLSSRHATLDDVFLSLTGHSLREADEVTP